MSECVVVVQMMHERELDCVGVVGPDRVSLIDRVVCREMCGMKYSIWSSPPCQDAFPSGSRGCRGWVLGMHGSVGLEQLGCGWIDCQVCAWIGVEGVECTRLQFV